MRAPRTLARLAVATTLAVATAGAAILGGATSAGAANPGVAPVARPAADTPGGAGPYKAVWEADPGLKNHTIYRPEKIATAGKMPIVVWGNGGCVSFGYFFAGFLTQIASQGYLVIANGDPFGIGFSEAKWLTQAMDWAIAENSRPGSKYQGRLDTSKIAVMGQSCGGLETLEVAGDPRITTTVQWDSGIIGTGDKPQLAKLHAPTMYITGGDSDGARANTDDDWKKLPAGLPAFKGALLAVGHMGTFFDQDGGEFGKVGVAWLAWHLKGDQTAKRMFVGATCTLCTNPAWKVEQRNLR